MISVAAVLLVSATFGGTGACADPEKTGAELLELARTDAAALPDRIRRLERALEQPLTPAGEAPSPEVLATGVESRLRALCALRERPVVREEASAERLKGILDRPEFEDARGRGSDALAAFLRRLSALWEAFLDRQEAATFADWTRALVLVFAAAVAVAGTLRFLLRRRRPVRRTNGASLDLPTVLDAPEAHLDQARAAADPREAIRQGLLALLSALERRRWARPDRVRTNLELARELPARGAPPEIAAEVERLVRWFDRSFYSLEPVSPDEATRFVDEIARLERRLSSREAA